MGRYRAMMDRRRLLCIEVVLLAAVVACTGSEGPSVEELSTTQLVELAETGPLPTEGTQDVVSPIMAAAKAKVQVLDVQETQEKLAEAKVIVAKETTKLAGDKVKLESSQVTVAAEQKIFDRKAAKVKKGEGSSASLKGPASKLATAKSSMIKLQSTVNSVQQKIDDASSIVTVDKKTVLRTKKVTASKSFSQLKADRDFNLKHTQAIATAQKASVRADQRSQQGIDIAKNEVESTKDREKRAAAKAKKLQVRGQSCKLRSS